MKKRDRIALLVSIAFVAAIGFMGYRFFNSATSESGNLPDLVSREETMDENSSDTTDGKDGKMDNSMDNANGTGGSYASAWTANDYVKGDIESGDYTVVRGDTLWEIAEAVYGDGAQWHKILDANANDIGYLPNGSQALIMSGQVLNIPQ